jgi:hypothetical protein
MEFTESVTGVQHATPGEVLVFQIDERYLNSCAGLKALSINAEGVAATDRIWQPFNFSSGLSARSNDRKFRSRQAALAASFRYSMPSDETSRANSISRVYGSHRDG